MSFRDNLQHLRATRNMTQEQLAMLVGVSRQSVTKWEAERSYPEMDKLLRICEIFDCTIDELVKGDLTVRPEEPALSVPAESFGTDVIGYDEFHKRYAWRMALGIVLVILGAAASAALDGFMGDGPMALALMVLVAAGLALIIPAAMERSAFAKAHPYVVDFYTDEQRIAERRAFGTRLAVGIGIILLCVGFGGFMEGRFDAPPYHGLFLAGIALGVGIIVHGSFLENRMDVESFNIDALEDLTEEEIAGIVGEERASVVLAKVRRSKRTGAACGVIMLIATAIALPLMFWATSSGDQFWTAYFWIPWMVGGFCCAVAAILVGALSK